MFGALFGVGLVVVLRLSSVVGLGFVALASGVYLFCGLF